MKKRFISFFCILFVVLLASCDLMGGSLAEYMTEFKENAALETYEISEVFPRDASGNPCIDETGSIIILLRNPMKYKIGFDYAFDDPEVQAVYDSLFKSSNPITYTCDDTFYNSYTMTFPEAFLEGIDTSAYQSQGVTTKDLSGYLSSYEATTLRPFGRMRIDFKANTVPETAAEAMLQLSDDITVNPDNAKYILCFIISRSERNYDFNTLHINNDVYDIFYNEDRQIDVIPRHENSGTLLVNPAEDDVPTLYPLEAGGDVFNTDDPWYEDFDIFYYLSTIPLSDDETVFTITIKDHDGLSSSGRISSKAERLTPVIFSINPTEGQPFISDINGNFTFALSHDGMTVENTQATINPKIVCECEQLDADGQVEDKFSVTSKGDGNDFMIDLSLLPFDKSYRITAYAKGSGYVSSERSELSTFKVIHNPEFFVSNNGNDPETDDSFEVLAAGTTETPYRTFWQTLDALQMYQAILSDYPALVPEHGYSIALLDDYSPASASEFFDSGYLIERNGLFGEITIRGANAGGGNETHTINLGVASNACGICWQGGKLNLKNLEFTGCSYSDMNANYPHYGAGGLLSDSEDEQLIANLTNCTFSGNTLNSSMDDPVNAFYGAGLAVITLNPNSYITIDSCSFKANTVSGGGGGGGLTVMRGIYDNPDCGIVELKGTTSLTNNTSTTIGGGIFCSAKLILGSSSVNVEANTADTSGAGLYVDTYGEVTVKGAVIKDNTIPATGNDSNVFLPDGKILTLQGSLSGSSIGITTATPWESFSDSPIRFAIFSTKPANGVFFSDRQHTASGLQIPVKFKGSEAFLGAAGIYGGLTCESPVDNLEVMFDFDETIIDDNPILYIQFCIFSHEKLVKYIQDLQDNELTIGDLSLFDLQDAGIESIQDIEDLTITACFSGDPYTGGICYQDGNKLCFGDIETLETQLESLTINITFTYKGNVYSPVIYLAAM